MTKSIKATKSGPKIFIVLGFDENRKPRGAKFTDPTLDILIKAAEAMSVNLLRNQIR